MILQNTTTERKLFNINRHTNFQRFATVPTPLQNEISGSGLRAGQVSEAECTETKRAQE